ncbi:MAG: hypothetical protein FJW37_13125, partial [Acidobacteria bacterium]|nr:hypothetical protein [Acidobacteriota bacterium]
MGFFRIQRDLALPINRCPVGDAAPAILSDGVLHGEVPVERIAPRQEDDVNALLGQVRPHGARRVRLGMVVEQLEAGGGFSNPRRIHEFLEKGSSVVRQRRHGDAGLAAPLELRLPGAQVEDLRTDPYLGMFADGVQQPVGAASARAYNDEAPRLHYFLRSAFRGVGHPCGPLESPAPARMKFLIIGSSAPHASEASYARLLRERGHEAVIWDNKAPSALFGGRSWWRLSWAQKIAYDALASYRCYRFCCKHQPDVLFLPKAENIRAYAIRKIQEQTGARLVMWYPDHPLKVNQTSMNVIRNLARCDIFYIWGRFLVEPIRSAGCRRVEYLPFGFDPVLHDPAIEPTAEERARYACDICFVGTWDEARERALEPLADFSLGIWGPQWGERVS